jgi:hypothetical protein
LDRTLDQFGGFAKRSTLVRDGTQKIQDLGMLRRCFQDLSIGGLGFSEPPLLLMAEAGTQELFHAG